MKKISFIIKISLLSFFCGLFCLTSYASELQSTDKESLPFNNTQGYQLRMDFGASVYSSRLYEAIQQEIPSFSSAKLGQYLGISVQQAVSPSSSIGSRIDIQEFDGSMLLNVRALDYHRTLSESFKANAFVGAASYQFRTPAYGYSMGFGVLYRPAEWGNWGLQFEAQYFDTIARDKLSPEDPTGPSYDGFDSFSAFKAITFGVNYYF
ncbi:hypothetical protein [uncultured Psychrosphaera sp.]|uniref:hypothetical protein n=1 Tax=uncultured Psychrosphaera sp. TaxID=1403522 RepID=UPI00262AC255|nr:hypothetical protein [uncultured Psychrosphaera sp.]